MKKRFGKTLGGKIMLAMAAVVIGMLLIAVTIFSISMKNISDIQVESNRKLSETTGQMSSEYMAEQTQKRLMEMAEENAGYADTIFADFKRAVSTAASVAEDIYNYPSAYSARPVPLPDPEKNGQLSIQVLYSASVDPSDPEIINELELLGNVQDTLMALNEYNEGIASIYVASESGFMVQADYISAEKYDDNGVLMPLEAKERPWYKGAASSGAPYFTPVTKDAHTPLLGIMCGVPVYSDGKLAAVAGGGMYLEDMDSLVNNIQVGSSGFACILNRSGQVIFSTKEEGTMAAVVDGIDLRQSEDPKISAMAVLAVSGISYVTQLTVDGVPSYVAFAPMKTVGWSLLVFLPQKEVEAPIEQLLESLQSVTDEALKEADEHVNNSIFLLLMLFVAAVIIVLFISILLSRRIVKPIHTLTEKVSSIEGDNLDFHWDLDTGDETQTLAASFESMTERMKDYIDDIRNITAEKERIGTELSLAKRIQESMLPSDFPAFPDRSEFDIYALMDPAREVGGDFYDFFFVDDDHLCLVMADVSGKGIPASLFMTVSKITLQSFAKLGMSPSEILKNTNDSICENNTADMFVTVWVGIFEISTGILTAANAGHEYPAIKDPEGRFAIFKDKHGFVVGGLEGEEYEEYQLTLRPGSKLFLYTDGVPEAKAPGNEMNMFGFERLADALNIDPQAPPEKILRNVQDAVAQFVQDEEQFDDLTMLCLEYKGA